VAKVQNGKGVGKTPMSAGVGSKASSEHSASGKAVSRVMTKGSTDPVAKAVGKPGNATGGKGTGGKAPRTIKGANSKNRTGLTGKGAAKAGTMKNVGGRGAARGR
jgi:hypothetical protein